MPAKNMFACLFFSLVFFVSIVGCSKYAGNYSFDFRSNNTEMVKELTNLGFNCEKYNNSTKVFRCIGKSEEVNRLMKLKIEKRNITENSKEDS